MTRLYRVGLVCVEPTVAIKAKLSNAAAQLVTAAFRKHASELRRYVTRRLRHREDAPDLTQEIFERFMRVDGAEAVRNPQAYLFRIASHVISERLCKDESSLVTYNSELLHKAGEAPDSLAFDELADKLALQRDIREALRSLPDNHLAALLLTKSEGLSYEEAAREVGLTEATIGTYVTHARAKLRLALADYYSDQEPRE